MAESKKRKEQPAPITKAVRLSTHRITAAALEKFREESRQIRGPTQGPDDHALRTSETVSRFLNWIRAYEDPEVKTIPDEFTIVARQCPCEEEPIIRFYLKKDTDPVPFWISMPKDKDSWLQRFFVNVCDWVDRVDPGLTAHKFCSEFEE